MQQEIISHSPAQTQALAYAIGQALPAGQVIAAQGDLGAGKTLFAAALARGLGVTDTVTSPTFIYYREYQGRIPFSHIDAYRLEGLEDEDIAQTGVDDALALGKAAFVEWPEFIAHRLPADTIRLTITRCPESEQWRCLRFVYDPVRSPWLTAALAFDSGETQVLP